MRVPIYRERQLTALRWATVMGVLCLVLVGGLMLGVGFGVEPIDWNAVLIPGSADRSIVLQARLTRLLLGALVGSGLAVSGVGFQALLRNPLADPYVLGVSAGAAVGATLALRLGASWAPLLPLWAFAGAIGTVGLVYAMGTVRGRLVPNIALLSGVIFNAFAGGVIMAIAFSGDHDRAKEVVLWLVGSLPVSSFRTLVGLSVWMAGGQAILWLLSPRLNALTLGEDAAHSLGVDVSSTRRWVFVSASLLTGAAVAVAGPIGFVGIVVPHALRLILGPDHRLLVPASALAGAFFLSGCDTLARLTFLPFGSEPPVGVVTALVGGPFFLVLLWRQRDRQLF